MVAAYASLVRLSNLIIQIRNHPRFSTFFDNIQIQYLSQNVDFLLDFVERHNSHGGTNKEEVEDLEEQIASAAYAAEYLTESYIEDQSIARFSEQKRLAYLLALHKLIVDMDFMKEKAMEVNQIKQPTYSMLAAPSRPLTSGNPTMVGFDDELFELMDLLTRQPSGLIIIPIVGMGGIGKTTLARNAFQHLLIKQNFDLCLWATISQEYSVRGILVQLLSSMQAKFKSEAEQFELGQQLYKSLYGRRYLIVLDDVWNIDVWNKIKVFCPNNGKRGRIVITTRLSSVATHCSSSCIKMKFLDEDKSWKLLCEKAFGEEECPYPELEEIGKEIVQKCNGIPLSIVVIGGHLRNSSRTNECWLEVANDINSILHSGEEEQCSSVLTLSYNHLPTYLKPCFLHIGIFWDEDEDIDISDLVQIWVAEGFLKQSETESLEEVAMGYIEDLLDRNLILNNECDLLRVPNYRFHELLRVQTFKIHDLLRDLCSRMAEKEKFVSALKSPPQHLKNYSSSDFRLLKKHLKDTSLWDDKFGVVNLWTNFKQVCLRYYCCKIYTSASCLYLHSSVFLLWNLQTLIINVDENVRIMAPSEIWEMPTLRHLLVRPLMCVPDPPPSDHQQDHIVLHNLQTLFYVDNLRLSEEVCKRIPNIKDFEVRYDWKASSSSYYCLRNLSFFKHLKSLICNCTKISKWSDFGLNLPSSLRKLCLGSLDLDWEDLTLIATMVPHLEDLKLYFRGSSRGQFNGEFPCLKSLTISNDGDFIEWNVEKSHFPVLENLTLVKYRLDEIPPGIIEIPTLAKIELLQCSVTAIVATVKAVVEQEELGEEGFQLLLDFWCAYDEERFWEMIEAEDLTSNNVVVNRSHRTNTTIRMKTRT